MIRLACRVLLGLLLALDCIANMVIGGSIRHTLSGEAWRNRDHKYWGWCHRAIDWAFFREKDHCRKQHEIEERDKSVWPAWRAGIRVAWNDLKEWRM